MRGTQQRSSMNDTKTDSRTRQEELGQFLTARPVADFMASMFGPLPSVVRLLDTGAVAGTLTAAFVARLYKRDEGVQHFIHHVAPHGMADFVLANRKN